MELKRRHQSELDYFREAIENGTATGTKIRWSPEVLDMMKKQEHLSNLGCYKDAKVMKQKVKKAQAIEKQRYMGESRMKLLTKSQHILNKHTKEMAGIKKKHASQRESLLNQRAKEFKIIELRFVNVWKELEGKFKKELISMDKFSVVNKMKLKAQNRLP